MKALIYLIFQAFLMVSCKNRASQEKVDIVYFGGTILTMGISDSIKDPKGRHYGREKKMGKLNGKGVSVYKRK
ncbi:hypothetical protein [Chryseobacterium sp. W4I1]|uniref:hypothetical protein n=1 Tax=Chryseobacterium sp. W4I1 TaxID=3042293 RepID=UPI002782BBFC|nr:hypothetical protein [Chryseobacterium sp. W4I1]MDQ0781581.1 hypothetical protein [Chryseobacterium sp. W4I1]